MKTFYKSIGVGLVAISIMACGNKANQVKTDDATKTEANVPTMSYKDRAVEIATEALVIRRMSHCIITDFAMNWDSFNAQKVIYDKDNNPVRCNTKTEVIRQRELFHMENYLKVILNLLNDMNGQIQTMKNIQSDGSASVSTLETVKEQCGQLHGYLLQNGEAEAKTVDEFLNNAFQRLNNLDDAIKQSGDIVKDALEKAPAFFDSAETAAMKKYRENALDPYIESVKK